MLSHLLAGALLAVATPQQMDTAFEVRSGGRLELENFAGSVIVRSWDRDQMRVQARHNSGVVIDINRGTNRVEIDVEVRRGPPRSVDFEITVPRRFDLEISGLNTSVDMTSVEGNIDVETINGDVTARGVRGRLDLASVSGRISVRDGSGTLSAEGTNQGIDVNGFDGNVSIATVNGSLVLNGIRADRVEAETINGRIEYSGTLRDRGVYELSTHNGEVVLYVPDGTNAAVSVSTHGGDIDSAFPVQLRQSSGRSRAEFNIGSGAGARIEITSFAGPIRFRRPRS